jgi:osmoprotectant transport system permease protein
MDYFIANYDRIAMATVRHAQICVIALGLALLIGVPLGIVAAKIRSLGVIILGAVSVIYTIPTLALFGLMIPLLGIGLVPALVAITLYSLLPIVQNTYTGIVTVRPAALEAAIGLGMSSKQRLARVELPLALLVIVAGIRTAVVGAVGMATLASLIGAGGLGDLVFRGISTVSLNVVLAGSIPVVVIAVLADLAMKSGEKRLAVRLLGKEAH